MHRTTLARTRLDGAGWAHPYRTGPFDPFLYADGAAGDASGSAATDAGNPPAGAAAPQGGQPPAVPGSTPDAGQDITSLPPWAQKVITDARAEAGKARTVAKQHAAEEARQKMAQDIGKALGLVTDDAQAPTPEQLTEQLRQSASETTIAQEDAASARLELHVYRTAARLGANADALLDSRAFCDTIDALDPAAAPEQFNAAVQKAIETALERNPGLRARGGAGRSGVDLSGGSGDQPHSLDKQIAEATAKRDFTTVIRLKRQQAAP